MKYLLVLLLVGCFAKRRIHWYCSNHKNVQHNGRGHLAISREDRLIAQKYYDCEGWYPVEVIVE